MALSELEERLLGVGKDLLNPPSDVEELLALLDQAEILLSKVEQLPKQPIAAALLPLMKALVAKDVMKRSNKDVNVSVASCISEITRITAPEPPYNDDQMKVIFEMIVDALEGLDEPSNRLHAKRILILETLAKVRSCLVMLDLECDDLILRMFMHFFRVIRSSHPERVHKAMETIMTLILEESEEISLDLAMCLLSSVKKDSKDISSIASSLGKRVIRNCTVLLKPCFVEVIRSTSIQLRDYDKIISSLCEDNIDFKNKKTDEVLAKDSSLSEATVSEENKKCCGTLDENTSCKNIGTSEGNSKSIKSNDKVRHVKASPVSNGTPDGNHRKRGRPPGSKTRVKTEIVGRSDSEVMKASSCKKRSPGSSDLSTLKKQKLFQEKRQKGIQIEKDLDGDSNAKASLVKVDKGESKKVVSRKRHNRLEDKVADLNENLVGSLIEVWWPMDKCFYKGTVESFDPTMKTHRILYVDGEIENLQIEKEKWKYADSDNTSCEEDRELQHSVSVKLSTEKAKLSSTSLKKEFRTKREHVSAFKQKVNISASNKKHRGDGTKFKSEEKAAGNLLSVDSKCPDSTPQSCSSNISKMEITPDTIELDNKAVETAVSSSTPPESKDDFDCAKDSVKKSSQSAS